MIRLGEVTKAQSGVGFPVEYQGLTSGDYPLAKVSDISNAVEESNGILATAANWVSEDVAKQLKATIFPPGSVLFAKIGEGLRLNRRGFAVREVLADNNVMGLIPNRDCIEPRYLYYFMLTIDLAQFAQTTAVPSVRAADVQNLKIPLPPLDEQKRIAAILEEADHARRTRRFTQSVSDTFLQEVFVEMFGDGTQYQSVPIGKLIEGTPKNGLYLPSEMYGYGTPIVRINNFYNGVLNSPATFRRVKASASEIEDYKVSNNDILINRVNSIEYLGKCALVRGISEPTVFESNMMRLQVNDLVINPVFLVAYLTTQQAYNQILRRARKAVNQASINQTDVQSILIPQPPLEMQNRYEQILLEHDALQVQQHESARQAEHLFQTLLHRAFRGEL